MEDALKVTDAMLADIDAILKSPSLPCDGTVRGVPAIAHPVIPRDTPSGCPRRYPHPDYVKAQARRRRGSTRGTLGMLSPHAIYCAQEYSRLKGVPMPDVTPKFFRKRDLFKRGWSAADILHLLGQPDKQMQTHFGICKLYSGRRVLATEETEGFVYRAAAVAVTLRSQGETYKRIAEMLNLTPAQVRHAVQRLCSGKTSHYTAVTRH